MDSNSRPNRRLRCAIYTRKSSEEGLDMEFNSLDAQREACEAYIASQKAEGWVCLRDKYDDGGFSGGTLDRPALKELIADIEDGLVRRDRGLQDRPPQPRADGFLEAGRDLRPPRCHLRLRHAVLQHHHLHGAADAEHPTQLCPVRARGHRRADPRQGRCVAQEGHLDGWTGAAGLQREGPQADRGPRRGRDGADDLHALRPVQFHGGGDPRIGRARDPDKDRQTLRQDLAPQDPAQQGLSWSRSPQRHGLSRRARRDH